MCLTINKGKTEELKNSGQKYVIRYEGIHVFVNEKDAQEFTTKFIDKSMVALPVKCYLNDLIAAGTAIFYFRGEQADKSRRSAKILAKKVIDFKVDPDERFVILRTLEMGSAIVNETKGMNNPKVQLKLLRKLSKYISDFADSYEGMMKACER